MRITSLTLFTAALVACQSQPQEPQTSTSSAPVTHAGDPRIDPATRAALSPEALAIVDRAPVPVLAPRAIASHAIVTSDGPWAAWSATHDGLTVSLHATNEAAPADDLAPANPDRVVRGAPAWITQNEAIWSAAWHEHGVAYSLELECAEPSEPRCQDERVLLAIADDLVVVGGRGVRP